MRVRNFLIIALSVFIISCSKPTNNPEFIEQVSGRYMFDADWAIEVYFENDELYLKWNDFNGIKPLKTDENTFFVKEINEKIKFLTNPSDGLLYISLVPKEENKIITYNYKKLAQDEKLPSEYFDDKQYDKAILGYLAIKKADSLNPIIEESRFNGMGYAELRKNNLKKGLEIFRINVALYPESSNVYDSFGEALLINKDTVSAIANYKKSLELNSGNRNAKRQLEKLEKKE